jgi:hypothetical protein
MTKEVKVYYWEHDDLYKVCNTLAAVDEDAGVVRCETVGEGQCLCKIIKKNINAPRSSSLGERFTSRASAGESCMTFLHPGRSVSPLDAHVLKKSAPLIGQSLLSEAWPPKLYVCAEWLLVHYNTPAEWMCEDVKMWRCEDVKRWRCEDVKMWSTVKLHEYDNPNKYYGDVTKWLRSICWCISSY